MLVCPTVVRKLSWYCNRSCTYEIINICNRYREQVSKEIGIWTVLDLICRVYGDIPLPMWYFIFYLVRTGTVQTTRFITTSSVKVFAKLSSEIKKRNEWYMFIYIWVYVRVLYFYFLWDFVSIAMSKKLIIIGRKHAAVVVLP